MCGARRAGPVSAEMSDTSLPSETTEEQEKEEVATEPVPEPQLPDEESVHPAVAPEGGVPPEGESGPAPPTHCQAWLLDMLDDVRYLISCTNWY